MNNLKPTFDSLDTVLNSRESFQKLPAEFVTFRRVFLFFLAIALSGGFMLIGLLLILLSGWEPFVIYFSVAITFVVVFWSSFFLLFWPTLDYRSRRYRFGRDGIEIQQGVYWKRIIFIPKSRIQHTDIVEGPLERQFKLSHLVIHTAGTISSTVKLAGLKVERAFEIRALLNDEDEADDI